MNLSSLVVLTKDPSPSRRGQYPRAIIGYRNRMLEMRRKAPVRSHRGPAILQDSNRSSTGVEHRLDGQGQPFLQAHPTPSRTEIGALGPLVHCPADPVTHEIPNDRE